MTESSSRLLEESPDVIANRLIQKAHNRDGLPEIYVGSIFLLAAGFNTMLLFPHWQSMVYRASYFAAIFFFMLLCVISPWLLKWVRRQFLIERVGYVKQKSNTRKLVFIAVSGLATFLLLLVGGLLIRIPHLDRWVLAGFGVFVGGVWTFSIRRPRSVVYAVLAPATGIVLAFSPVSMQAGLAIVFSLMGLVSLLSGCVVFLLFIRQPIGTGA